MRQFVGYERGINLGGWLSQCGKDHYCKEHYDSFITEKDIEEIASWGLDHVRLPIDYNVIQNEDGTIKPEGFYYVDQCISWCRKNNLKIVLDLHKTLGYVFDDKEYCNFFFEEKLQDSFVALWEEIARRYGQNHEFMSFELLNEVTMPEVAEKWNEIAERTIKAIRNISKEVQIIIGGIYNSSIYGLTFLRKPADENIVFTFHCYSPMIFTHQGAGWVEKMPLEKEKYKLAYPITVGECNIRSQEVFGHDFDSEFMLPADSKLNEEFFEKLMASALEVAEKFNVPLYCGEYGVIDRAEPECAANWYHDIHTALAKYGLSRAAWTYKRMDFGLSDEHYLSVKKQILQNL